MVRRNRSSESDGGCESEKQVPHVTSFRRPSHDRVNGFLGSG